MKPISKTHVFSPEYKYKMFLLWYKQGRLGMYAFHDMVTLDDTGSKPSLSTLKAWQIQWKLEAEILDNQVRTELEKRMVKEKVEMLSRHADLGKQMQDLGIEFITDPDNKDSLTSATAVRLLVAGVEIERDSRGLPDALKKIMTQSDDKLLEEIKELTKNSPIEISPIT